MKQKELYKLAMEKWGETLQIIMAIEEMAELSQVLTKTMRGYLDYNRISEEVADVEIMLAQLRVVFPLNLEKDVQRWKRKKKYRLLKDIRQNQNELNFENKERGDEGT